MSDKTPAARARIGRWLLKHLIRFVVITVVVFGPNIVFFGRYFWPDKPLPKMPSEVVQTEVEATSVSAALKPRLAAALVEGRERAGLPSMSGAISWDGRLQWAGATGLADIEANIAATPRSRYRTGSVAKPITAIAMMRLAEAGKLDLDAPLSRYLPKLPVHTAPLSARLLASHQAGVRHYTIIPKWWMGWHENYSQHHYASVEAGLSLFINDRLRFAPGSNFLYSTFGYSLLSRELEVAAGSDFPTLLQTLVFEPAGMIDTKLDGVEAMQERVAFYQAEGNRYTRAWPIDSSYKIAGGGLVSTPSDLVRLGLALSSDTLVSAPGRTAMMQPMPLADGTMNPQNYALGWRIDDSVRLLGADRPVRIWHHGGSQPGAAAFLMILPEHGIVVAAMSNSGTESARLEVQETTYALARLAIARGAPATKQPE